MLCLVGPLPLGRGRNIMAETSHMTRLNSSASLAHSNFPEREGTDANVCIAVADLGAAYGTAKSGVGICSMGVMHPTLIMKCKLAVMCHQLFYARLLLPTDFTRRCLCVFPDFDLV